MDAKLPAVAVVVPVRNEAGNIERLVAEIAAALDGQWPFEIVYVNDGSSDGTEAELKRLMAQHAFLRRVRHKQSCGQSAAVRTGVKAARAPLVVTLDGDGQNDPAFIPALLRALEAGAPRIGLIAGQRVKRKSGGFKKFQSRIANAVRGAVLRDGTRDTGCGLKAFRARRVPGLALFRWPAPLPAGAGPARGLCHRLCRRGRSAARIRRVELRHVGPAVDRNPRSRRRVVADPPPKTNSGDEGG